MKGKTAKRKAQVIRLIYELVLFFNLLDTHRFRYHEAVQTLFEGSSSRPARARLSVTGKGGKINSSKYDFVYELFYSNYGCKDSQ